MDFCVHYSIGFIRVSIESIVLTAVVYLCRSARIRKHTHNYTQCITHTISTCACTWLTFYIPRCQWVCLNWFINLLKYLSMWSQTSRQRQNISSGRKKQKRRVSCERLYQTHSIIVFFLSLKNYTHHCKLQPAKRISNRLYWQTVLKRLGRAREWVQVASQIANYNSQINYISFDYIAKV